MQEANARKRLQAFPLLPAVYAMANGEAAPTGTALDLCLQAGSILSIVLDVRQDAHPSQEISETLKAKILKQLGLK